MEHDDLRAVPVRRPLVAAALLELVDHDIAQKGVIGGKPREQRRLIGQPLLVG